jgi:hypothetical protein
VSFFVCSFTERAVRSLFRCHIPVRINPNIYILSFFENVYMSIKLSDFLLRNIIELLVLYSMSVRGACMSG